MDKKRNRKKIFNSPIQHNKTPTHKEVSIVAGSHQPSSHLVDSASLNREPTKWIEREEKLNFELVALPTAPEVALATNWTPSAVSLVARSGFASCRLPPEGGPSRKRGFLVSLPARQRHQANAEINASFYLCFHVSRGRNNLAPLSSWRACLLWQITFYDCRQLINLSYWPKVSELNIETLEHDDERAALWRPTKRSLASFDPHPLYMLCPLT